MLQLWSWFLKDLEKSKIVNESLGARLILRWLVHTRKEAGLAISTGTANVVWKFSILKLGQNPSNLRHVGLCGRNAQLGHSILRYYSHYIKASSLVFLNCGRRDHLLVLSTWLNTLSSFLRNRVVQTCASCLSWKESTIVPVLEKVSNGEHNGNANLDKTLKLMGKKETSEVNLHQLLHCPSNGKQSIGSEFDF